MAYFENGIIRNASTISLAERPHMIKEYLETDLTKVEIWRKYTGLAGKSARPSKASGPILKIW